jgi:membrane-bound lytic murein transglycosylase D
MTQRRICVFVLAAGLMAGGCDDSARRTVQVRPPAAAAGQDPAAAVLDLRSLPLNTFGVRVAPPVLAMRRPDGADLLLNWAEAQFQGGLQEYKAGHLKGAQRQFAGALEGLTASGLDLRSDARLGGLYDRILETSHAYGLAALTDADFFAEPASVAAPIDEIAEMSLPADPGLREAATHELARVPHDLPLQVNDIVLKYLNFFRTARGRAIVEAGLRRAGRYQEMIRRVFREEGLPQDLIFLAQAESGFQPQALSRAGARGIWQFMSWRGREYGLQKSWWVDERQDPEKSTRAAARHLRDLYEQFGDWYLAMAAYDCGPGNVSKGIERTGYADFWELYNRNVLPKETKNYVPIILGFMLAAKNAAYFGIEVQPEPALRADVVKPGAPIDLRLVAESLEVDLDTLRVLNPALLRLVTPADPTFELRLPEGLGARFQSEIVEAIPPDKWVSWRLHRVEEGETLSALARKFKVTPTAIAEANGLETNAPLAAGERVIIPAAKRPDTPLGQPVRYRVRKGDTLRSVADEFDVTVSELKRWNGLRRDTVRPGVRLKVSPGGRSAPAAQAQPKTKTTQAAAARVQATRSRVTTTSSPPAAMGAAVVHQVKHGETLWSIAKAYQTTVDAVRQANRFLASRPLQAGDQLTIFPPR